MSFSFLPLTQGHVALVDNDCPSLEHKWRASVIKRLDHEYVYGRRSIYVPETGKYRTQYLHRFILGEPAGYFVDHKNRNTLDCRTPNLRKCTRAENAVNCRNVKNSKSEYRGVDPTKSGTFRARIRVGGRVKYLKTYKTAHEAARAFDDAARVVWGDFAVLNFPQ